MKFYVVNRIPIKRRVRFNFKTGRAYTDSKTTADMKLVKSAYKGEYYTCPVALIVLIYKQLPKQKRDSEPFDVKPDIDNVLKAVMDGLKGVAYRDDNQVTVTYARKMKRESTPGEYVKFAVLPAEKITGVLIDPSEVTNEI